MLKANVGLSRKISRDYNSTGYSVNLDGEILASTDDTEAIIEKIRELFSLAQEALAQEIDRDQGEAAIGRRDEDRPEPRSATNDNGNGERPGNEASHRSEPAKGNDSRTGNADSASNKQVQFLLTMGKRFKLSSSQLESRIAEIIGRRCGVYDLSKKEAGQVLDQLTQSVKGGNGNSR